jgi:ATP-dependent helicase/nuclease subunit A
LNFINDFFAASHLLNAVEAYTPMRTHRPPTGETRVEFMLTGADAGEDRLRADERRQREAEFIAQRIRELTAPDTPVRVWDNKAEAWRAPTCRDVAVLFRAMSNAHLYEEALRNAGVPYVLVGGRGFFRCQEVIDVINLLTVIVDPWDEIALLGFLRGPFAGLNDESVFLIAERGGLCPAFQSGVVPENITQATELSEARKLVGSLRARQEMRPEAFIRRVLEETGVEAVLLAQYHGLQKASNVRKLVDLAADFAATGARSLRALAAYLREAGEQEVREGEAPEQTEGLYAVTLMTVHKSKGLEFPVVIVPDMALKPQRGALTVPMHRDLGMAVRITGEMSDEKVSSRLGDALRNRIQEEERAEHARLLYVALTRARDYLILCGATNPPPGSWFGAIDAVYPVVDAPQDGGIAGVGWSAAVRTCVLSAAEQSAAPDPVVLWEEDTLRQRIEPVQGAASARRTFSISSILDFMAEGMDEQEERDEAEERPPSKAGAAAARARGTLVHRFFETWDFRAAPEACIASVLSETARTAEDYASLQTDLANIAARFFAQPLCAELAQSDALQREAPFLLRADNAVISGTIDALAGDLLIDYKTGRPDDRRTARYEWQLLLYAAAVRTLLGYTPTRGIVAYVDHDVYHPVELSPEQIDSALRQAREVVASMRAKGGQQRREGAVS